MICVSLAKKTLKVSKLLIYLTDIHKSLSIAKIVQGSFSRFFNEKNLESSWLKGQRGILIIYYNLLRNYVEKQIIYDYYRYIKIILFNFLN